MVENVAGNYFGSDIGTTEIADNAVTLAKLEDGTQGDILYYAAAGAPTRLGAGTAGQFLKTNGAAANPSWAAGGGFVYLGGTSVGAGGANSVSVDSLSTASYSHLMVVLAAGGATGVGDVTLVINDDTAEGHYYWQHLNQEGAGIAGTSDASAELIKIGEYSAGTCIVVAHISNIAAFNKGVVAQQQSNVPSSSTATGTWLNAANTITKITIGCDGMDEGSKLMIYGISST